jgi:hypothetical protein
MIQKLLNNWFSVNAVQRRADMYRLLIHYEAKMGGELFGPIPEGRRREFFCLDERTWVWHEEWRDESGKHRAVTTRYDVRPDGILKSQGDRSYQAVRGHEAENLYAAVIRYQNIVGGELERLMQPA